MKDITMKSKHNVLSKLILSLGATLALASGVWLLGTARAAEPAKETAKPAHDMVHMEHIMTQTQAEALKPGDSMAMTCAKCKHVMVQKVVAGSDAHIKMMTVGEKMKCPSCGGSVEVVATGKGKGKDAEVKHVCSKCGDDAMFCTAVKPGSGAMKDMPHDKK